MTPVYSEKYTKTDLYCLGNINSVCLMVCERIHVNEGVVDTMTPSLSSFLKQICNSGHAELSLVCYRSNIHELQGRAPNRHIYTTNRNLSSFACSQSRGSGGVTS